MRHDVNVKMTQLALQNLRFEDTPVLMNRSIYYNNINIVEMLVNNVLINPFTNGVLLRQS
jgi:hypothetical protein